MFSIRVLYVKGSNVYYIFDLRPFYPFLFVRVKSNQTEQREYLDFLYLYCLQKGSTFHILIVRSLFLGRVIYVFGVFSFHNSQLCHQRLYW